MGLVLRSKGPVRFELVDAEAEITVTLAPDEAPEVLVRKLKRIIALTEKNMVDVPLPAAGFTAGSMDLMAPPQLTEQQRANGWDVYDPAGTEEV